MRFALTVCLALAAVQMPLPAAAQSSATSPVAPRPTSFALESDVLSFGINGYSGIVGISLPNGLQVALGTGRYDVPNFLLSGDANYDAAQWRATSTSVQVLRATYRFNGPMKNGLALGGVVLNQNWHLRSESLGGETKFRPLSVGVTAGYYLHIGKHFYVYPTTAFTYNSVVSGSTTVQGTPYKVAKFAPNASLHAGWEWSR